MWKNTDTADSAERRAAAELLIRSDVFPLALPSDRFDLIKCGKHLIVLRMFSQNRKYCFYVLRTANDSSK